MRKSLAIQELIIKTHKNHENHKLFISYSLAIHGLFTSYALAIHWLIIKTHKKTRKSWAIH